MANEFTIQWSMSLAKQGVTVPSGSTLSAPWGFAFPESSYTVTGTTMIEGEMLAATSPTVVPLGSVTQPHWGFFWNLDATNYVTLRNGVAGAILCRLLAGEASPIPLDPSSVPYVTANTASCAVRYAIISL